MSTRRGAVKGETLPGWDFSKRLRQAVGGDDYKTVRAKVNEVAPEPWSYDQVRDYLSGKTEKVPAAFLLDFSRAYDVHPVWLLTGRPRWTEAEAARDAKAVAGWLQRWGQMLSEHPRLYVLGPDTIEALLKSADALDAALPGEPSEEGGEVGGGDAPQEVDDE